MLRKKPYISQLKQIFYNSSATAEETKSGQEACSGFTLSLKVKEKGKMMGLEIDVEESYPLTPIKVAL